MHELRFCLIIVIVFFIVFNLMFFTKRNIPTGHIDTTPFDIINSASPVKIVTIDVNGFRKEVFTTTFQKGECLIDKECSFRPGKITDDANMYLWEAVYLGTSIDKFKIPQTEKLTGLIDGEPRIETEKISEGRSKFDITIDYRKESTIRWLYARNIIDNDTLFHDPAPINKKKNVVAFINSNCRTASKREQYVKQMMDIGIVNVKSYGKCLKNSNWPKDHRPSYILDPSDPKLAGKYEIFHYSKFCIAIENSVVTSYNSEKLWHALACGCVPIYLGDTEINNYLPTIKERMYLDIRDFDYNMTALSLHVKFLMENDDEYNKLLQWKKEIPKSNGWYEWKKQNSNDVRCEMCKIANNY